MSNNEDLERVIADHTKTLERNPGNPEALFERGRAWYRKEEYAKAIADLNDLLKKVDGFAGAWYVRALAYSKEGDYGCAIQDFTNAIANGLEATFLPDCYYNRGRCLYMKRSIGQAISDLSEAVRLDVKHARAYMTRGLAWQLMREFANAISDFSLAIHSDPNLADAYHNRGNALVYLGSFRKAIADFSKAIDIEPDIADSYTSRAVAWKRKGRYSKALADYERALGIDPDSVERNAALAEFLATCPQNRFRDGARALELITKVCERTGYNSADYVSCLAAVHAELGDFKSAVMFQRKAISLSSDEDDKEDMMRYIESYQAGERSFFRPPSWRERWA